MFMSVVVTILSEASHVHVCCGDDTVRDKFMFMSVVVTILTDASPCSCLLW